MTFPKPNLASLGVDLGAHRLPQSGELLEDGGALLGGEPARLQLVQVVFQLGQVRLEGKSGLPYDYGYIFVWNFSC